MKGRGRKQKDATRLCYLTTWDSGILILYHDKPKQTLSKASDTLQKGQGSVGAESGILSGPICIMGGIIHLEWGM